jgi:hypothetical protein
MMNYPDDMLKAFTVDVPLNRADRFEKFYTVNRPASVSHWLEKAPAPRPDDALKSAV